MKIGQQIKALRNAENYSQDDLSEKIFVSRQTISSWENDKSYPDLKSLILISDLFGVSIDELVKGDIDSMKEKTDSFDVKQFEKLSGVFACLMVAMIATPMPLAHFLGKIGWAIWAVIAAVTFWVAFKVEKLKKSLDIQTYKEILAFTQGKSLDRDVKNQEIGKRSYEKIALSFGAAAVTIIAAVIFILIFKFL